MNICEKSKTYVRFSLTNCKFYTDFSNLRSHWKILFFSTFKKAKKMPKWPTHLISGKQFKIRPKCNPGMVGIPGGGGAKRCKNRCCTFEHFMHYIHLKHTFRLIFINILHTAFTRADRECAKKNYNFTVCLTLLGSAHVKAVQRTLMKLTPNRATSLCVVHS